MNGRSRPRRLHGPVLAEQLDRLSHAADLPRPRVVLGRAVVGARVRLEVATGGPVILMRPTTIYFLQIKMIRDSPYKTIDNRGRAPREKDY